MSTRRSCAGANRPPHPHARPNSIRHRPVLDDSCRRTRRKRPRSRRRHVGRSTMRGRQRGRWSSLTPIALSALSEKTAWVGGGPRSRSVRRRRPAPRTWELHNRLHTWCTLERMQNARRRKALICRDFAEPSDGLEPSTPSLTMEVQDRHARTRAITRGTVLPANRVKRDVKNASRGVARVVSDVSVLCPRAVVGFDNYPSLPMDMGVRTMGANVRLDPAFPRTRRGRDLARPAWTRSAQRPCPLMLKRGEAGTSADRCSSMVEAAHPHTDGYR
jgi:hypothetical protein